MRAIEAAKLALGQIRAQKLKSAFAVVGVVIGVTFLIAVVSIVEGMDRYMKEDFARQVYGLNTITIRRTPSVQIQTSTTVRREWARRPRITHEDARAIREHLGERALVAVESNSGGEVASEDGIRVENVWLTAASGDYFRIREMDVSSGRLFSPPEDRLGAPVVVLGSETAETLFGPLDPIGRSVRIRGMRYEVIGVLQPQGRIFGFSLDNRAIAPANSALARVIAPTGAVSEILVRMPDAASMTAAMSEVEAVMRARHRLHPRDVNTFEIETAEASMAFWIQFSRILFIAFPALVGIALVVGGMVIMNIMLISVTERTREIGIRKAIGARRSDIRRQVLVEGATLSGIGAAAGIGVGLGMARAVAAVSPLPAAVALQWIILAVAMGVGVGVIAGVYPAVRASRMVPVDALRHET